MQEPGNQISPFSSTSFTSSHFLHVIIDMRGRGSGGGNVRGNVKQYYRIVFCGVFQSYWYRFLNVKTENKQKFEFLTGTMTNRELSHIIDSSL